MYATIRLFNSVPAMDHGRTFTVTDHLSTLIEAANHGITFAPEVIASYSPADLVVAAGIAIKLVGKNPAELNNSFHKSWEKVATAPMALLVLEQAIHYMTTYGAERLGVYSDDRVFIPAEELDVPGWDTDVDLHVINLATDDQLRGLALAVASRGVALSEQTLEDLMEVFDYVGITPEDVATIENRELAIMVYRRMGLVPTDPVEFLRYLIFVTTGKTLIIKNESTRYLIKQHTDEEGLFDLFSAYDSHVGYAALSSIFLRYKPIFLAFKGKSTRLNRVINDLRRLAVNNHAPLRRSVLDRVSSERVDINELNAALASATPYRRIRILNSLQYRMQGQTDVVYSIRNGKTWSTQTTPKAVDPEVYQAVLDSVVASASSVAGKTVLIPEYMNYTLPTSEKMFVGNFPFGTSVNIDKDMVFGVQWTDVDRHRIDLDLSASSIEGKIGWDGAYRNGGSTMLFSGDMTSAPAPLGASEMFRVGDHNGLYLVNLNYFNHYDTIPVPFKLFVSKNDSVSSNFMVDQNSVLAMVSMTIHNRHQQLGLVESNGEASRFFFVSGENTRSISFNGYQPWHQYTRQFYLSFYSNAVTLKDILERAGATVVGTIEDGVEIDLDLSPNVLTKDSILSIFA